MLDTISDEALKAEYVRRFTSKRGARIAQSKTAAQHFQAELVADPSQERFMVMFLNGQNELIAVEELFRGTLTTSAVYPREVVRFALKANAAALLLAHNHPSGNLNPSQDDVNITKRIKDAVELLDMVIHDHLIVAYGKTEYYSFADNGLL